MLKIRTTYAEARAGIHPDIPANFNPSSDDQRSRVALTLLLRDRFAPLCDEVASQVRGMDAAAIQQVSGLVDIALGAYDHHVPFHSAVNAEVKSYFYVKGISRYGNYYYDKKRLTDAEFELMEPLRIPVGAYGKGFALRLAIATGKMLELTGNIAMDGATALKSEEPDLLRKTSVNDPVGILKDGIVSIAGSFSLLMAEPIPGYERPLDAMEAIHNASLPRQLSLVTPFGLMGPMIGDGFYIKGIVSVGETGRLKLSTAFVKAAHAAKEKRRASGELLRDVAWPTGTGLDYGCPVGKKVPGEEESAISALTEAVLHVFRLTSQA